MSAFANIKLAYFDLDGTIIYQNKKPGKRTLLAFDYLKQKNIKVGIATGRTSYLTKYFFDHLQPNAPTICVNGGWILDENFQTEIVFPIQNNATKNRFLTFLNKHKYGYLVYTTKGVYSNNDSFTFWKRIVNHIKSFVTPQELANFDLQVVKTIDFYKTNTLLKILVHCASTLAVKNLQIWLDQNQDTFRYYYVGSNYFDINDHTVNKAVALQYVLQKLQIQTDELIFFGNEDNDVDALTLFPHSVAVKDGSTLALQAAKHTTFYPCAEEGVADFIFQNF